LTRYRVYAWHSVLLSKHLLNVYRVFRYLFDPETRVIARKIALLKAMNPTPELEEELEKVIHVAVILHDSGKGLEKYQERVRNCISKVGERITDDTRCFCSFRWHETVSAQIYASYVQYYLLKKLAGDPTPAHIFAAVVGLFSILHHHHAMRLIYQGRWREEVNGCGLADGAVDEISLALRGAGFPPLHEVIPNLDLDYVRMAGSTAANQLPRIIEGKGKGVGLLVEEVNRSRSSLKFHEMVTSRLVIADIIASSLERRGELKGYAAELARELRLSIDDLRALVEGARE